MFIGNLNAPSSGVTVSYSYRKCSTTLPLPPDHPPAEQEKKTQNGFAAGWNWNTLLGGGVDIVLTFHGMPNLVFLSQVILYQTGQSSIEKADLLRKEADGTFAPVGCVSPQTEHVSDCGSVLSLEAGCFADEVILRIKTDYRPLWLSKIEIIGAVFDEPLLYPMPAQSKLLEEDEIPVAALRRIYADPKDTDALAAAEYLQDIMRAGYGIELELLKELSQDSNVIRFERAKDAALPPEGFLLQSSAGCCRLAANDRRGMLYAAGALFELSRGGTIPAAEIRDWPFMPMRGVHIGLPDREHIPFLKRLIRYLLVLMRYNTIFIEISAGMRYDRHPEINAAWVEIKQKSDSGEWPFNFHTPMVCNGSFLEKDEVRDLFEFAESLGLEAIPEIHSLSHAQFLTKAFPQIAEIPAQPERGGDVDLLEDDGLDDEFYPSCYCPSNEESYQILFDIIDEVVETLHPKRYLHMGHDEVYRIGVCEKCRGKDPARLYADDVNRIHDYVASKGLTMMLWGDMLHTATKYKTPPAIDWIPKDIVMLDFIWYFHMDLDLEERLLNHGFPVLLGNLYSSHFPRFEKRIRQEGILGGEVSTWVAVTEEAFALEGKLYDLVYTANMLWSAAYRSEARTAYDQCAAALLRQMRPMIHGDPVLPASKTYHPISLKSVPGSCQLNKEEQQTLERWKSPWIKDIIHFETVLHATAETALCPRRSRYEIPVGKTADGFLFVHACDGAGSRIPWEKLDIAGEYQICYADGGSVRLPIQYGGNAAELLRRYGAPLKSPYFRHEGYLATYFADPAVCGKTACGEDFTLYGWEWRNPEPERRISSIVFQTHPSSACGIYLFGLS